MTLFQKTHDKQKREGFPPLSCSAVMINFLVSGPQKEAVLLPSQYTYIHHHKIFNTRHLTTSFHYFHTKICMVQTFNVIKLKFNALVKHSFSKQTSAPLVFHLLGFMLTWLLKLKLFYLKFQRLAKSGLTLFQKSQ